MVFHKEYYEKEALKKKHKKKNKKIRYDNALLLFKEIMINRLTNQQADIRVHRQGSYIFPKNGKIAKKAETYKRREREAMEVLGF